MASHFIKSVFSKFMEVLSGVPQGSVLGPDLFLVYVIDLESSLKFSDALTFADDTKIIKVIRGILDHANLQEELRNVVEWSMTISLSCCVSHHSPSATLRQPGPGAVVGASFYSGLPLV